MMFYRPKTPLPLYKAYSDIEMEQIAMNVLRSGQIASGRFTEEFIHSFGALIGNTNIVPTSDMSDSIELALKISGVGWGDEVLTTPYACMATNAPIVACGAKPAWVDVLPQTGSMDPEDLMHKITSKTKALILYHVAGYPAHIKEISEICSQHGVVLIEDCNNALLAKYGQSYVGEFGEYSIHSFYPNRLINATEGGALACASDDSMNRATKLKKYGVDQKNFRLSNGEINPECDIPEIGWAATFNNLCSALGLSQIQGVVKRLKQTRSNAHYLDGVCNSLGEISRVIPVENSIPSYWVYLIQTFRSKELINFLHERGIGSSKVHFPNHRYSGFHVNPPDLVGCDKFYQNVVAIPCGWWLGQYDLEYIAEALFEFESLL